MHISDFNKITLKDVNLYKDLSSESYSIEGSKIYNLATINIEKYLLDNKELKKISVFFDGSHEDLKSDYYFKDDSLQCVKKNITSFPLGKYYDKEKGEILEYWYIISRGVAYERKNQEEYEYSENAEINILISDSELYKKIASPNPDEIR